MKLLVFPNDPMINYFKKGELRDRYYNPENFFDEIHFVTFNHDECEVSDIQVMIGDAKGFIHRLDSLSILDLLFPNRRLREVLALARSINPDIVRSYNPIHHGYYAACCAKDLGVKFITSLHTNYDKDIRGIFLKEYDFLRYFKYLHTKLFLEKKVLAMTDKIIAAYKFTAAYAIGSGASKDKISLIYNRVYFSKFHPVENYIAKEEVKVICVGSLVEGKGQRTLVDSIPHISSYVTFTFVGDGEDYDLLQKKVKDYKIEDRVTFIRSIPNSELAKLYREHDIFSLPIKYGGICIPAIEATASGLALVMPKPIHEESPEITGDYALVVPNSVDGFSKGIEEVAANFSLREDIRNKGLDIIKNYSGDAMEKKEADVYRSCLS